MTLSCPVGACALSYRFLTTLVTIISVTLTYSNDIVSYMDDSVRITMKYVNVPKISMINSVSVTYILHKIQFIDTFKLSSTK